MSVRVVPDTSGFDDTLRRDLRDTEIEVPVRFVVDDNDLRRQIREMKLESIRIPVELDRNGFDQAIQDLGRLNDNVTIDAKVDEKGLRDSVTRASKGIPPVDVPAHVTLGDSGRTKISIPVDADTTAAAARVREFILGAEARDAHVKLVADLDNTAAARVKAQILALGRDTTVHVNVDVDRARVAAMFAGISGSLARVGSTIFDGLASAGEKAASGIGSAFSGAGDEIEGLGGKVGGAIGPLVMMSAVSAAIAVAGAGIAAAYGLAATAVAALPGALSLAAVPIAAVVLGLNGIKAAAKTLQPEFDKLKASLSTTFEQGLTPIFERLRAVFPTLTAGLNSVAQSVVVVASGVADFLVSARGIDLLTGIFDGVATAVRNMAPGIRDITDALLTVASRSVVFDVLTAAVNRFGQAFTTSVTNLISDGTLDAAFRGLGAVLQELTQGFVDLVENGIRLFATAAPGVASFLRDLTDFFNRFDFASLGASVGGVFRGLGEALSKVPTETFRAIEAAFAQLGATFQDPAFQDSIVTIIESIPAAVRVIDDLTRAFADLGALLGLGIQGVGFVLEQLKGLQEAVVPPKNLDWGTAIQAALGPVPAIVSAVTEQTKTVVSSAWTAIYDLTVLQFTAIGTAISQAWAAVRDQTVAELTTIQTAISSAWTAVYDLTVAQFTSIGAAVTAAFVAVRDQTIAELTTIQTAITSAWTAVQTATATAWTAVQTFIATAWASVQAVVASAIASVQAAVTSAWAAVQAATSSAWAAVQAAVASAWASITATVSSALASVQTAVSSALASVTSTITSAMASARTAVASAWQQIVSTVQSATASVLSVVRALPGQIVGALGNLGGLLVSAGRALIDGLLAGIKAGVAAALQYARTIAAQIAAVKGPRSLDLRILTPAGQWLMDGLLAGLRDGMDKVRAAVESFTREFARVEFPAPSLESMTSVSATVDKLIADARRLSDAFSGRSALDDLSGRIESKIRASVSATPNAPTGDRQLLVTINAYNPVAEPASETAANRLRTLAELGTFG